LLVPETKRHSFRDTGVCFLSRPAELDTPVVQLTELRGPRGTDIETWKTVGEKGWPNVGINRATFLAFAGGYM
jgi:hypothetical protein